MRDFSRLLLPIPMFGRIRWNGLERAGSADRPPPFRVPVRSPLPGRLSSLRIPTPCGMYARPRRTKPARSCRSWPNEVSSSCCGGTRRAPSWKSSGPISALGHPFVSESGGGLFVPVGYFPDTPANARAFVEYDVLEFGRRHAVVAAALHEVANRLRIGVTGFSDMSVDEVATACRLSLAQARLAMLREYDEPFRIADTSPAVQGRLFQGLRRAGFRCFTHEGYQHVDWRRGQEGQCSSSHVAVSPSAATCIDGRSCEGPRRAWSAAGGRYPGRHPGSYSASVARLLRQVSTARLANDCSPGAWGQALRDVVDAEEDRW